MKISCLALFLACFSFAPLGASPRFEVVRDSAGFVPRWSCGQFVVTPPAEGLWSIATAWRDGAPAEWRHVRAVTCERTGEWTILSGELACRGGRWLLRDAYRVEDDLLHCIRRYEWTEGPALDSVMLGIRWQLPHVRCGLFCRGSSTTAIRRARAIRPTMSCVTKAGPASSPFSKNTAIRCRSLRSRSNAANVARQHRSLRCPARSPIRVMRITGGRSACGRRTGIPNCCCCRDRSATMVVRGPAKRSKRGVCNCPVNTWPFDRGR